MKFTKATTRFDSSAMMLAAALLVSICLTVDGASGAGAAMMAMPQDRAAQSGLDRQALAQLMQRITSAARRGLGLTEQTHQDTDWKSGATADIHRDVAIGLLPAAEVRLIPPEAFATLNVAFPIRPNLTDLPPPASIISDR